MAEEPIVSFCIPVFNQLELVKRCVASISAFKGNEIEIIVNDDCSTDDLLELVVSFNDSRIKYFRNKQNLGHDLNILESFKKAKGKYVFLLRSRDYIVSNAIPNLVETLSNSDCMFATPTCLDEKGKPRYKYSNKIIKRGKPTMNAHFKLYVHPSGCIYKNDFSVFCKVEDFIKSNIDSKYGFLAHSLLRLFFSQKGDFQLIDVPTWVYVDTRNQTDVAVNKLENNKSTYDPEYTEKRFLYEVKWANLVIPITYSNSYFLKLYAYYLENITWGFKYKNNDKNMQKHYQYKKRKFSALKENKLFTLYAIKSYCDVFSVDSIDNKLKHRINRIKKKNAAFGWFKYFIMFVLKDSFLYKKISSIYRRA